MVHKRENNGGSWLQKNSLVTQRQTVTTEEVFVTQLHSFQCRKSVRGVSNYFRAVITAFGGGLLWQTPPRRRSHKFCDSKSRSQLAFISNQSPGTIAQGPFYWDVQLLFDSALYFLLSIWSNCKLGRLPWLCPLLVVTILVICNLQNYNVLLLLLTFSMQPKDWSTEISS